MFTLNILMWYKALCFVLFFSRVATMYFCSLIFSPEFHKANFHLYSLLCSPLFVWKGNMKAAEDTVWIHVNSTTTRRGGVRGELSLWVEKAEDRGEGRGGICSELPLACLAATQNRPPPAALQVDRAATTCRSGTNQRTMLDWCWPTQLW